MDSLAGLQFRQTKNQRNKPRSVWPKIVLGAMVFGLGYVGYMNYPVILAKIAGKPSTAQIERLLVEPLAGSLSVQEFKVPARFVEITAVHVRNVETFDKRDGVVFYRATGDAVARLTASGRVIVKDVEGQIGGNARRLNYRSAVEAVYSRFQAHSAIADVPAGTQYPLGFEVVVRVVDGNTVLVDGNVTSDN